MKLLPLPLSVPGILTAKGKTVVREGWKAVDRLFRNALKLKDEDGGGAEAPEADKALPPISEGQTLKMPPLP